MVQVKRSIGTPTAKVHHKGVKFQRWVLVSSQTAPNSRVWHLLHKHVSLLRRLRSEEYT